VSLLVFVMHLGYVNKKLLLTSREIQTAVRLVLPGELCKHSVSEGTKAVTKFNSASSKSFVSSFGALSLDTQNDKDKDVPKGKKRGKHQAIPFC